MKQRNTSKVPSGNSKANVRGRRTVFRNHPKKTLKTKTAYMQKLSKNLGATYKF